MPPKVTSAEQRKRALKRAGKRAIKGKKAVESVEKAAKRLNRGKR